jgi:2-dehydropantoate 2-reductase
MRYLVFGTGAVGGLLGARLALSGQPVTFLARPRLAGTILHRGLQVTGDGPPGWLKKPNIITTLKQAFNHQPPDIILLTVKAYDCKPAAAAIHAQTTASPTVVCLLNGIGNEDTLAGVLGPDRVIAATMTTAVQMIEPGILRVERQRGYGLTAGHPLTSRLKAEMTQAGLRIHLYQDPAQMKWSKVLINIVTNATSAITGWPPRRILEHPGLYRLEIEALRETVRVMSRKGLSPQNLPKVPVGLFGRAIFLPPPLTQPILRRIVSSGRGDKLPSFHYDIGRGRSEVRWLNGAVVQEGNRLDVPTPANAILTETMLALIDGSADPAQFRHQPERLIIRACRAGVPGVVM